MAELAVLGTLGFVFASMWIYEFGPSRSSVVTASVSLGLVGFVFFAIFPGPLLVLEVGPEATYDRTSPEVVWKGTAFYKGQKVITKGVAGVVSPDVTGLDVSVNMGRGHVGTVVEARERNRSTSYVRRGEPLQALLILWDEQEWSEDPAFWRKRRIAPFSSTIHACWLRPLN